MDHQRSSKHKKADILLGDDQSHQRVDVNEWKLRTEMEKKQKLLFMSEEEIKIRGELESDVERNLEEEIKDGIYSLALRLHRLYQHQKERKASSSGSGSGGEALSEVNISIRMEGGTKVEIMEMNKQAPHNNNNNKGDLQRGRRPWSSRSENVKPMPVSINKKLDWAGSLRSGMDPPTANNNINRKSGRSWL